MTIPIPPRLHVLLIESDNAIKLFLKKLIKPLTSYGEVVMSLQYRTFRICLFVSLLLLFIPSLSSAQGTLIGNVDG
jgi:hypothetical protein